MSFPLKRLRIENSDYGLSFAAELHPKLDSDKQNERIVILCCK